MTCYELEQLLKKNNNFADNITENIVKDVSDQEPYVDTSKIDQDHDWSEWTTSSD